MNNTEDINYPAPKQEYKVLVRCFTYNQSKYIEDALNGFAMQQTNFPFVCLVMDDASTDGEQRIIKNWMGRECDMSKADIIDIPSSTVIIVPHKTNSFCLFTFYFLKHNLFNAYDEKMKHVSPWREKCEYETICEGDDYWIDSLKLQKQVDFLDANPDYGLVYTNYKIKKQNCNELIDVNNRTPHGNISLFLLKYDNPIITASVCIRKNIVDSYLLEKANYKIKMEMGDLPLWIYASKDKLVYYLDSKMVVYRLLSESASHSINVDKILSFMKNAMEIKLYMNDMYSLGCKENKIIRMYYRMLLIQMSKLSKKALNRVFVDALIKSPSSFCSIKVIYYIIRCLIIKN